MASKFNTIHIFGFGTVQVIGKDLNVQTSITNVQAQATACIDNVWSKKPADNTATKEYHAVNIFSGMFADWQTKIAHLQQARRRDHGSITVACNGACNREISPVQATCHTDYVCLVGSGTKRLRCPMCV